MKGPKGRRVKPVPQRTCVACGETTGKRRLVRIVRTATGEIEVDPTGKKAGRGAYLCSRRSCWELALRKRAVERSLRTTLTPASRAALEAFVKGLPEESPSAEESTM